MTTIDRDEWNPCSESTHEDGSGDGEAYRYRSEVRLVKGVPHERRWKINVRTGRRTVLLAETDQPAAEGERLFALAQRWADLPEVIERPHVVFTLGPRYSTPPAAGQATYFASYPGDPPRRSMGLYDLVETAADVWRVTIAGQARTINGSATVAADAVEAHLQQQANEFASRREKIMDEYERRPDARTEAAIAAAWLKELQASAAAILGPRLQVDLSRDRGRFGDVVVAYTLSREVVHCIVGDDASRDAALELLKQQAPELRQQLDGILENDRRLREARSLTS